MARKRKTERKKIQMLTSTLSLFFLALVVPGSSIWALPAGTVTTAAVTTTTSPASPLYSNLPAECQSPIPHTCSFYYDCLETAHPCGPSGYAVSFGGHYCQGFHDNVDSFTPKGQEWLWGVMTCLQVGLIPYLNKTDMSCDALANDAFNMHVNCYTHSGPSNLSLCDLDPLVDWVALIKVIGLKTIFKLQVIQNEVGVGLSCIDEYTKKALLFLFGGVKR